MTLQETFIYNMLWVVWRLFDDILFSAGLMQQIQHQKSACFLASFLKQDKKLCSYVNYV